VVRQHQRGRARRAEGCSRLRRQVV